MHLVLKRRLLLSMKTGSGKSSVAYLAGVTFSGVVFYISPLLSLGAQAFAKAYKTVARGGR